MSRISPTCCLADRLPVQITESQGWRLEHDPTRHPFVVLIGGGSDAAAGWAVELSAAEAAALRAGVARLVAQHAELAQGLMAEEAIDLELEVACAGGCLWIGLHGDRSLWRLGFVLSPAPGRRAVEGRWDGEASPALAAALGALPLASEGEPRADSD